MGDMSLAERERESDRGILMELLLHSILGQHVHNNRVRLLLSIITVCYSNLVKFTYTGRR